MKLDKINNDATVKLFLLWMNILVNSYKIFISNITKLYYCKNRWYFKYKNDFLLDATKYILYKKKLH